MLRHTFSDDSCVMIYLYIFLREKAGTGSELMVVSLLFLLSLFCLLAGGSSLFSPWIFLLFVCLSNVFIFYELPQKGKT